MLNLLLRKDRYDLKKEYSLRFWVIMCAVSIVAIVIFMVLLFSINIFVWVENQRVINQLETVSGADNTQKREEVHEMTRDINKQINVFKKTQPEYSGYLTQILNAQPAGVGITSIDFSKSIEQDKEILKVTIQGQSGLRDNMVLYTRNLRQVPQFKNVNLPLSNLTQDTNVNFRITLETDGIRYKEVQETDEIIENEENE
jgi:Tfp pilus assembly protein PilN